MFIVLFSLHGHVFLWVLSSSGFGPPALPGGHQPFDPVIDLARPGLVLRGRLTEVMEKRTPGTSPV
jgi:hypothetical protein